jgi:hypothetical protein
LQKELLENFIIEINNTREYINHIKFVNEIAKDQNILDIQSISNFKDHYKTFYKDKKLFEHKAVIINLYGILENSITLWIIDHIKNIPSLVKSYNNLSDTFRQNHFDLTIKLISLIKPNTKYENYNKEDTVKKLSDLINDPLKFELNYPSYIPQSGNLKYQKITEALKYLDIDLDNKLSNKIKSSDKSKLIKKIDLLVTLRNDIAHGNPIENRLDITEFEEYIILLEELGKLVFSIFVEKELEYDSLYRYDEIGNIIKVHYDYWLEIEILDQKIKENESCILKDNKNNYFINEVLLVDINEKEYKNFVIIKSKTIVWIKFKNKITNIKKLYIEKTINTEYKLHNLVKVGCLIDHYQI